jgi:SPP1 gp7 family putative phage head morphogenesis protein
MPPLVIDMLERWRADLLRGDAAAQRQLARRWLRVEQALQDEIAALTVQLQQQGGRATLGQLTRSRRYLTLLRQVQAELMQYQRFVEELVTNRQQTMVNLGQQHSQALLTTLAPALAGEFDRLPVRAAENMVGLTASGNPLRDVLRDASRVGPEALADELVRGLALGENPKTVARRALRQGLARSFTRMATIARTETLRVYRQTALERYRSSGLVVGYRRVASKSARTCVACLMADGRFYALDEPFDSHPGCRCTLVPVLRTGQPMQWETGQEWFRRQPERVQREMLGPARYDLWRNGQVTLDDLVTRVEDPVWGGALVPTPVRALPGGAEAVRRARVAAGVRQYYDKPGGSKVMGFTFYDAAAHGLQPGVGRALAFGQRKDDGWAANERIFKEEFLPRHHVRDDVKRALGLWGAPEPSFNVWLKGSQRNILALAKDWGKQYNQEAMALLVPHPTGAGGALSWDFGRRLTVRELDRVLGGVQQVNQVLRQQREAGRETEIYEVGLTVLGRRRLEFWVDTGKARENGTALVEQALRVAGVPVPVVQWEGGYEFRLLFRGTDY